MSNQHRIHHVPAGSGPAYWGPGDEVRFILTGAQTGGAFFLAEVLVPPGGGPPPHIHEREDETFYLLQGTLTVQVGDQTIHGSQGDCAHLPRGIVPFVPQHRKREGEDVGHRHAGWDREVLRRS